MVEKMGRGINLGNVLSAPIEGNWSPEVLRNTFLILRMQALLMLEYQ